MALVLRAAAAAVPAVPAVATAALRTRAARPYRHALLSTAASPSAARKRFEANTTLPVARARATASALEPLVANKLYAKNPRSSEKLTYVLAAHKAGSGKTDFATKCLHDPHPRLRAAALAHFDRSPAKRKVAETILDSELLKVDLTKIDEGTPQRTVRKFLAAAIWDAARDAFPDQVKESYKVFEATNGGPGIKDAVRTLRERINPAKDLLIHIDEIQQLENEDHRQVALTDDTKSRFLSKGTAKESDAITRSLEYKMQCQAEVRSALIPVLDTARVHLVVTGASEGCWALGHGRQVTGSPSPCKTRHIALNPLTAADIKELLELNGAVAPLGLAGSAEQLDLVCGELHRMTLGTPRMTHEAIKTALETGMDFGPMTVDEVQAHFALGSRLWKVARMANSVRLPGTLLQELPATYKHGLPTDVSLDIQAMHDALVAAILRDVVDMGDFANDRLVEVSGALGLYTDMDLDKDEMQFVVPPPIADSLLENVYLHPLALDSVPARAFEMLSAHRLMLLLSSNVIQRPLVAWVAGGDAALSLDPAGALGEVLAGTRAGGASPSQRMLRLEQKDGKQRWTPELVAQMGEPGVWLVAQATQKTRAADVYAVEAVATPSGARKTVAIALACKAKVQVSPGDWRDEVRKAFPDETVGRIADVQVAVLSALAYDTAGSGTLSRLAGELLTPETHGNVFGEDGWPWGVDAALVLSEGQRDRVYGRESLRAMRAYREAVLAEER